MEANSEDGGAFLCGSIFLMFFMFPFPFLFGFRLVLILCASIRLTHLLVLSKVAPVETSFVLSLCFYFCPWVFFDADVVFFLDVVTATFLRLFASARSRPQADGDDSVVAED